MSITDIGGYDPLAQLFSKDEDKEKKSGQAATGASFAELLGAEKSHEPEGKATTTASEVKKADPVQEFLEYMKKTPEERMQEAWLRQHGISEEEWEAMPPEEKQALMDQMKQEIQTKLQKAAEETQQAGQQTGKPQMLLAFGLGL